STKPLRRDGTMTMTVGAEVGTNDAAETVGPQWPMVTAIIATRGRPGMLRMAIHSILEQDYSGEVELLVVFDQTDVEDFSDISLAENRTIRVLQNTRTPGLTGGRNTGINAATGTYVAFCDDDDEWLPGKLSAQVRAWRETPEAVGITTGIRIVSPGGEHVRVARNIVTFSDFLASRVQEIHPSSFLWRRSDLLGRVGLIDEQSPASYGEDYDLLLRATRIGGLRCVRDPLVVVHWNRASFFDGRWQAIADGLTYLLRKYPEFDRSDIGTAR